MRKLVMTHWLGAALLAAHPTPVRAADIFKEGNADDLNLGSSWVGGTAPASADVAVWDHTVFSDNTTVLGADLNWLGIRIADPDGLVTVNDSGHILILGAAGIDLSAALRDLTLNNGILLATGQSWNVAADRTLTVNGVVNGPNMVVLTKNGDGLLVMAGSNAYAGGTTLSGGLLQLNSATAAGTGPVRLGGGALVYNPAAGLNVANPIEIMAGTTNMILVTSGSGGNPISSGAWSGGGTVLISNTFSPYTVNASMAGFSGTVLLVTPVGAQFRFNSGGGNPNTGSPDAVFDLGSGTASLRSRKHRHHEPRGPSRRTRHPSWPDAPAARAVPLPFPSEEKTSIALSPVPLPMAVIRPPSLRSAPPN